MAVFTRLDFPKRLSHEDRSSDPSHADPLPQYVLQQHVMVPVELLTNEDLPNVATTESESDCVHQYGDVFGHLDADDLSGRVEGATVLKRVVRCQKIVYKWILHP